MSPDRHRRRHDRSRGVDAGRNSSYVGDPDRRRPGYQRHRHGAAHADARGRGHQGAAARWRNWPIRRPVWRLRGRRPAEPQLSRRALADVIQLRVEELYELIQNELRRAGFEEVRFVRASSSLAAPASCPAWSNWARRSFPHAGPPWQSEIHRQPGDVVQCPRFSTAFGLLLEAQAQRKRGQKMWRSRTSRMSLMA